VEPQQTKRDVARTSLEGRKSFTEPRGEETEDGKNFYQSLTFPFSPRRLKKGEGGRKVKKESKSSNTMAYHFIRGDRKAFWGKGRQGGGVWGRSFTATAFARPGAYCLRGGGATGPVPTGKPRSPKNRVETHSLSEKGTAADGL